MLLDRQIFILTPRNWDIILGRSIGGIQRALDLTWEVFLQFEAPEYSQEGIDFFRISEDSS